MTISLLLALWTMEEAPRVIEVLEGAEFVERGIVADLVERPAGLSDEEFAQSLVDAEGLRAWNGEPLRSSPSEERLGSLAVFLGDGREIHIRFRGGDAQRPGRVCRLRFARGGVSAERWSAYRWCAAAFGMSLPETPGPVAGSTPLPPLVRVLPGRNMSPREAVLAAADAAPAGVPGVFMMRVVRTGRQTGRVFLNSEADYRDQRNLTISIDPATVAALTRRWGTPPDQRLQGRFIGVRGIARRTRIDFFNGGRRTGLYYYQTHVVVAHPAQISIMPE